MTLHLLATPLTTPAPTGHHHRSGFLGGLSAGWHGFLGAVSVLLTGLGPALPFLATIAAVVGVAWWSRRAVVAALDRRRTTTTPTDAA